jgi:hypothetical protein
LVSLLPEKDVGAFQEHYPVIFTSGISLYPLQVFLLPISKNLSLWSYCQIISGLEAQNTDKVIDVYMISRESINCSSLWNFVYVLEAWK